VPIGDHLILDKDIVRLPAYTPLLTHRGARRVMQPGTALCLGMGNSYEAGKSQTFGATRPGHCQWLP